MRALTCIYGNRGGAGGTKSEPWNPLPETLAVALNSSATVILEAEGIVAQVGDARRNRVYRSEAILDVLEEPLRLAG